MSHVDFQLLIAGALWAIVLLLFGLLMTGAL